MAKGWEMRVAKMWFNFAQELRAMTDEDRDESLRLVRESDDPILGPETADRLIQELQSLPIDPEEVLQNAS